MTGPREIELKRGLRDQVAWARLCAALGAPRREELQRNIFVDTASGALRAADLALRLRQGTAGGAITVKGAARRHGALSDRLEIECAVDATTIAELTGELERLRSLDLAPLQHVRGLLGAQPLVEVLRFDNLRRSYPLTVAGHELILEVDRVTFGDGSIEHEVEVEVPDAALADPVALALHALLDDLGVAHQAQPLSKFTRARARR